MTCLLFVGCDNSDSNNEKIYKSDAIKDVRGNNFTVTEYVDESTGVHYLVVQEYQSAISLTPMYNTDGTLKVTK